MGESLGCHSSAKKAGAQIGAIEKSESKSMKITDVENVDVTEIITEKAEDMEDEMEESTTGLNWQTMGLHAFCGKLRDVWEDENEYSNGWIAEVMGDHVIVRKGKEYWKVPYSIDGDSVKFGEQNEWMKVKLQSEWVEKGFAIKSLGENRIGGYAVLWGGSDAKDLHGEYFDEKTEELDVIFKSIGKLPFLFHHGRDKTLKTQVIGEVDVLEPDDAGLWWEAKIKEHDLYRKYVKPLIGAKALFTSSGCLPGSKESDRKSGYIKRWAIGEITGTHMPAEYRMLEVPIGELSKSYDALNVSKNEYMKLFNPEEVIEPDQSQGSEKDAKVEKSAQTANRLKLEIRQRQLNMRLNKYN